MSETLNYILVVGYKRKDFWLDISARDTFFSKNVVEYKRKGKFGPGSWLDISARGNLETLKIVWLGIGARQKFARIVVGYKRKGKIWTKIMVGYKRKGQSVQPPVFFDYSLYDMYDIGLIIRFTIKSDYTGRWI